MIKSFDVRNFRGFRDLRLSDLTAVNIVVGKSASGKTALLEAIRLGLGATPQVAWNLNAWRGILVGIPFNPAREIFESAWSSYFFDFDITQEISFKITDSEKREASLKVFFDKDQPITPGVSSPVQPHFPTLTNTIIPLAFQRVSFTGEESKLHGTIATIQGQLFLQQGPELGTVSEFFPSTWQSNAQQVATWFSNLRIRKKSRDIVAIIRKQFPEIKDISSETPQPGLASLYATVAHHAQSMPISLVSSGINKFISLLIAIRTYRNGVVLIDEIENGVYFKMFPALWEALHKFAVQNKTQLFLSTHSWECLEAASAVVDKHKNDFALIQVVQEKGISIARVTSGDKAAGAIEAHIEVRK
jgi:predicted ATP-dependent endonuclease of OLD family